MPSKEMPYGVMCYWKWEAENKDRRWTLVEAFPIDCDGYRIGPPDIVMLHRSREEWNAWMNVRSKDGENWEPIMGRAVTVWTFENGVSLTDLHPPQWADWLPIDFIEELKKSHNWSRMLECGHDLYLGTARAAETVYSKSVQGT